MLYMAFDNDLLYSVMMHQFDDKGQGLDTTSISFDPVHNDCNYELYMTTVIPW
jgi:hypothetical protein